MSPNAAAWLLAFVCLVLAFPVSAHAGWPEHPVKLIVTFPPGSANDAAARIFADGLSKKWGKPVVVEDRPGAEGTIGVGAFVASQDDHTLLYTVAGSVTVAPLLIDHLTYDVDRDLVPVAATTAIVLTLAVTNDLPIRSIPDLINVVRSNPGTYAWASGPSLPRYVFAAFLKRNDLVMNFVSYRDASQPQADLGEGRIQVLVTSLAASSSPVQSGKAHFLAVINPTRAAALPELQTARELGHPELEIDGLAGFFAGTVMSTELRNRIAADVAAVCQEPEARRKLEAAGHNVLGGTTGELKAGIAQQRAWLNEVTRIIDVKNAQ
ncbi:Bug family tripartite tricarboxylate transporter substrate binding protein [Bradyrhizobium sp. DASA03120]|uniref:Bug family tripartite tricarboxylate transporter substrate binding protein n=1 Tax=Bradyrhizobium sp. SMVTL-02 TaxID=3395917 RepID=UPI003F6E5DFB